MAVAAALPTAARELDGAGRYGWAFTGFLVARGRHGRVRRAQRPARRPAAAADRARLCSWPGCCRPGRRPTSPQLVGPGGAGPRRRPAHHRAVRRRRRAVPGAAAAEGVRRDLVGLGGALAGRPAGGRCARPAPELALVFLGLVPLVWSARAVAGAGAAAAARAAGRSAPTRPGSAGARSRPRSALARWCRPVSIADRAGSVPAPVGGLRCSCWGCRRLLPRGTVRCAAGCRRRSRCAGCSPARCSAPSRWCRWPSPSSTATRHRGRRCRCCRRARLGGRLVAGRAGAADAPRHPLVRVRVRARRAWPRGRGGRAGPAVAAGLADLPGLGVAGLRGRAGDVERRRAAAAVARTDARPRTADSAGDCSCPTACVSALHDRSRAGPAGRRRRRPAPAVGYTSRLRGTVDLAMAGVGRRSASSRRVGCAGGARPPEGQPRARRSAPVPARP